MKNQINTKQSEIRLLKQSLLGKSPQNKIRWDLSQLESKRTILIKSLSNYIDGNKSVLASLSRSLEAVSPLSTLDRGYSITYGPKLSPLKSANNVKIGDKIRSHLQNGNIESVVSKIENLYD